MPKAIIVMGPPGAGKGTQAKFIAEYIGGVWYDTGAKIRERLAKGEISDEEYVKKGYASGKLFDPNKTLNMVLGDVKNVFASKKSIVLSGSPRSVNEAFGSGQGGLMHMLEDTYGKENVIIFAIHISIDESIKRNMERKDGRKDDSLETIRVRYEEQYEQSVLPTIEAMKIHGCRIIDVDGMPSPEKIFKSIQKHL